MAPITPVCPFDMVVFGGSGDLAMRKLYPSLFYRDIDGQLPAEGRVVGVARRPWSREEFIGKVEAACREFMAEDFSEEHWPTFVERLFYASVDASTPEGFNDLKAILEGSEESARVFYLATAPDLFGPTCENLKSAGLVTDTSRVVLEKPLGRDLASAEAINEAVGQVFKEQQIYRIDHYLGKETVQNLMVLRFGNALFQPLWNNNYIDHVQITVAEKIGVEGRGGFYDKAGALRDMVQNHLLQLLCIIAMEPPSSLDPDDLRDEKRKVLRALRMMDAESIDKKTVRGQYKAGAVDGKAVPGYAEEEGIDPDSNTETFVCIKAEIDNWRWAGVPFYMRTGKRLAQRSSEIVIHFKDIPHSIFGKQQAVEDNQLVIRLQPEEWIRLRMMAKDPGPGMALRSVDLDLDFKETFKARQPGAYERLLMDVIRGKPTLFMRRDELDAAWEWVEPILDHWTNSKDKPKTYAAGSWGPSASIALIERDGFTWFEE